MRAEELFDPRAREQIEAAVQEAERHTSGEIVPMVVTQSHDYAGVRAVAAALLAFAAGVGVLASPLEASRWLPPLQVAVFAAGYALAGWRPLLFWLVPRSRGAWHVDRAAKLAFVEEGLVETRDRTGILIFVSLLEHRVEILADRGIDACVEDGTWDGVVRHVLDGIRTGEAEHALCQAITECGRLLATPFPPRGEDPNELPNQLRS
ncbi:MAG: hypothetical protein JRG76_00455 [Deltaproteobacteria bacterium]|nr:hypothetical protein [Deltaproteobacteria bacterium]MBW2412951.1 hypothetical protein [Deltaproteobacteria bacterium]